jgi:transposase
VRAGVPAGADAAQWLAEGLAQALTANEQLAETAAGLRAENEQLRERLEAAEAGLAVLQRMMFGRSSEKSSPAPGGLGGDGGDAGGRSGVPPKRRGKSGNRRRDYSHLPRVEVVWDFGEPPCCDECGMGFEALGSDDVFSQVDWEVIVRLLVHRRRRYRRACPCTGPRTVTAPGPPKAIGKGLLSNAFIAMLLTERYVAGRSQNSLVTGLARHGAQLAPGTVAGTVKAAGALLAPLEEAVTARSRDSWHLHADETSWHVFVPGEGDGPARWWLWVFLGPDTVCFVMDPSRAGAVLARHAGIDSSTGQLAADEDGGPRRLVISSDFYAVYQSAGKKADGLVNLYCWAQYAESGIMRNGAAGAARVACRGGDRSDAGAGRFCIIAAS